MLYNVVGGNLVLWPPECAAERYQWEVAASNILRGKGFKQVVTPHLYKKALQAEFADWFGNPEDHLFHFELDENKKECCEYVPLGNRHLPHIQIFRERPCSYRDLPVRYFEIAEYYDGPPVGNMPCIYLTTFCEQKDMEAENELGDNVLDVIGFISENIRPHSGEFHRGERKQIVYAAADNSKKPIAMVTANLRFIGLGVSI